MVLLLGMGLQFFDKLRFHLRNDSKHRQFCIENQNLRFCEYNHDHANGILIRSIIHSLMPTFFYPGKHSLI